MRKLQYNVKIRGTNTMLLHKYTPASVAEPKLRVNRGNDAANYAEEWVKATYLNKDGQVVMPWTNIFACLFDGSKGMKKGKTFITRIIYTSLLLTDQEPLVLFDNKPITIEMIKENDWLHATGAVISGRRIDRIRTAIPEGYEISFGIATKPNNTLTSEDIESIITNAGIQAGLGDWRPSSPKKPGPYGTFEVISFEEVK